MALYPEVDVTIDREDLARFVATDPQVDTSYRALADRVANEMRNRAPQRSGRLAQSITVEQSRDTTGRYAPGYTIGPTVDYAQFVVAGTRPHRIDGNPLLVFYWPKVGATVAFRHVNHPGTSPNNFMDDAIRAVF